MERDEEIYEDDAPEITEGGSEIYRHQHSATDAEIVTGDEALIDAISKHIEKHLGPIEGVFHELISERIHVDVHWVKPTEERPFNILITSGMSELPMKSPKEDWQFAELCVLLPPDWPMDEAAWEDENNYWPIRWLKKLARLPHEFDTWLGYGHTIPNGDPAEGFSDNTDLSCWLVVPPVSLPPRFVNLVTPEGKHIIFWGIVAIYDGEMSVKLNKGTIPLLERFEKRGISDVVDPHRKSIFDRTGSWWKFGR